MSICFVLLCFALLLYMKKSRPSWNKEDPRLYLFKLMLMTLIDFTSIRTSILTSMGPCSFNLLHPYIWINVTECFLTVNCWPFSKCWALEEDNNLVADYMFYSIFNSLFYVCRNSMDENNKLRFDESDVCVCVCVEVNVKVWYFFKAFVRQTNGLLHVLTWYKIMHVYSIRGAHN